MSHRARASQDQFLVFSKDYPPSFKPISSKCPWDSPLRLKDAPIRDSLAHIDWSTNHDKWLENVCDDTLKHIRMRDLVIRWAKAMVGDEQLHLDPAWCARTFWTAMGHLRNPELLYQRCIMWRAEACPHVRPLTEATERPTSLPNRTSERWETRADHDQPKKALPALLYIPKERVPRVSKAQLVSGPAQEVDASINLHPTSTSTTVKPEDETPESLVFGTVTLPLPSEPSAPSVQVELPSVSGQTSAAPDQHHSSTLSLHQSPVEHNDAQDILLESKPGVQVVGAKTLSPAIDAFVVESPVTPTRPPTSQSLSKRTSRVMREKTTRFQRPAISETGLSDLSSSATEVETSIMETLGVHERRSSPVSRLSSSRSSSPDLPLAGIVRSQKVIGANAVSRRRNGVGRRAADSLPDRVANVSITLPRIPARLNVQPAERSPAVARPTLDTGRMECDEGPATVNPERDEGVPNQDGLSALSGSPHSFTSRTLAHDVQMRNLGGIAEMLCDDHNEMALALAHSAPSTLTNTTFMDVDDSQSIKIDAVPEARTSQEDYTAVSPPLPFFIPGVFLNGEGSSQEWRPQPPAAIAPFARKPECLSNDTIPPFPRTPKRTRSLSTVELSGARPAMRVRHSAQDVSPYESNFLDRTPSKQAPLLKAVTRLQSSVSQKSASNASATQPDTRPALPPDRQPLAWCQTRQELCETFPRFRAYQGGVYFNEGLAHGYLLGGFPAPTDQFLHDGRLIISHGGGGSANVENIAPGGIEGDRAGTLSINERKKAGKTELAFSRDQSTESPQGAALWRAWKHGEPLVLIAQKVYSKFPWNCGEKAFVILGWYVIQDIWFEPELNPKSGISHNRMRVAFAYCDAQDPPWWHPMPKAAEAAVACGGVASMPASTDSPPICAVALPPLSLTSTFSSDASPNSAVVATLSSATTLSTPEFSAPTLSFELPPMPGKLRQGILVSSPRDIDMVACTACKLTSPLVYAIGPICLHPECSRFWSHINPDNVKSEKPMSFDLEPTFVHIRPQRPHPLVHPATLRNELRNHSYAPNNIQHGFWCENCGRMVSRTSWSTYNCPTAGCTTSRDVTPKLVPGDWRLPYNSPLGDDFYMDETVDYLDGEIEVGPDCSARVDLFTLPFERGSIAIIRGNEKTNDTANMILVALNTDLGGEQQYRLRRHPLRNTFSQLPMVTQFFSQNFGVPYKFVARNDTTVSFEDSPASIRNTRDLICQRARLLYNKADFNELLIAAYLKGCQMNFHSDFEPGLGEDVAALSLGMPATMTFRAYNMVKGDSSKVLEFKLYHGDIIVMHGHGIQKCYEHQVEPEGLRIAATARFIDQKANATH